MITVRNETSLLSPIESFIFEGDTFGLYALSGMFYAHQIEHIWLVDEICVNIHILDSQDFIDFLTDMWENCGKGLLENHTDYFRTVEEVKKEEKEVEIPVKVTWQEKLAGIPRKLANALF